MSGAKLSHHKICPQKITLLVCYQIVLGSVTDPLALFFNITQRVNQYDLMNTIFNLKTARVFMLFPLKLHTLTQMGSHHENICYTADLKQDTFIQVCILFSWTVNYIEKQINNKQTM